MKKIVRESDDNEWDWLDAELHRGKYAYDIDARCDVCGSHLSKSDEIYKNDYGFIVCMKCHHKKEKELEESKEPLWWAVCVRSLDDDPFDDHEYTLGYFGVWSDAKKECIKDMNRYINDKLIGKDIRKYEHMKNDCIVGVETNDTLSDDFVSNPDDARFWLIKPVDFPTEQMGESYEDRRSEFADEERVIVNSLDKISNQLNKVLSSARFGSKNFQNSIRTALNSINTAKHSYMI